MTPRVKRLGFEPRTDSLEGCCSIQLSYRSLPRHIRCRFACAGLHICVLSRKFSDFFLFPQIYPHVLHLANTLEAHKKNSNGKISKKLFKIRIEI